MNPILKQRNILQIIACRHTNHGRKVKPLKVARVDVPYQLKIDIFAKKQTFSNQDKILLIRYIEGRYRVRFGVGFVANKFSLLVEKDRKVLERSYDSKRHSYFIVRGKLTICQKGGGLRETSAGSAGDAFEQIMHLQEGGVGNVFCPETEYHRCLLICQNAVVLAIQHQQSQLDSLQRNCLLTTAEKESAVKEFPLLRNFDSINKYYVPYFQTRVYTKGESIYSIGDQPEYLYLVVEGEIQFQSRIQMRRQEKNVDESIAALTLRNTFPIHFPVNTQSIGTRSFFGEEELIALSTRQQNAKCSSITALLMLVPLEKFTKLMNYNQIRDTLISTARDRSLSRQHTIQAALSLSTHQQQTNRSQTQPPPFDFADLNKRLFMSKPTVKEEKKISLVGQKVKIVHGNPMTLQRYSKGSVPQQRFSMLEVNQAQYKVSMKMFKGYRVEEKKRKRDKNNSAYIERSEGRGRSLKQVWQVLKLDQILQDETDKVHLQNSDGKIFYNAHMKLQYHLNNMKSYRPRTLSSHSRARTQYYEYLHKIL